MGQFAVIGCPDDLGVKNVNGRTGAASGPQKFLEFFQKMKGEAPIQEAFRHQEWVVMGPELEVNHDRATTATRDWVKRMNPKEDSLVLVGGGHDYAYSWIRGVVQGLAPGKTVGCINLDAHFDLRGYDPVMTSGSPFRRLIQENLLDPRNLIEFGIQNHCNAKELWEYAREKKIPTIPLEKLRNGKAVPAFKKCLHALKRKVDFVLISLDLDALSFAHAPGVSAPQAEGFTASEVFQMLEWAGSDAKVISLGVFELAPPLDVQDLTARLAAQAAYKFIRHQRMRRRK